MGGARRGLRQRARLLNALAADLYGPQRLLRDGLIPPALVVQPSGLSASRATASGRRAACSCTWSRSTWRAAPTGRWRVVDTRTQAPSGAGYALENRATIPRVFPDAFRDLHVQPLAPFFETLQETLSSAPRRCDEPLPHVVLLTPGPYNETYFEHAYLARHLGFPLVEGGDLTVRDDRVFLKTVSGLRQVHAILRRLDDDYCDPLELRADSTLGVPGLVQAWRAGRVLVANAFGTGVLESPALFGMLPAVCERLLGEPLESAGVVDAVVRRPAGRSTRGRRMAAGSSSRVPEHARWNRCFSTTSTPTAAQEWADRFGAAPDAYVVEECLPLSHAPAWHEDRLESRALMLRVFLAADGHGDYTLMPGGLSRIAGDGRPIVSSQRGGEQQGHVGAVRSRWPCGGHRPGARRANTPRRSTPASRAVPRSTCSGSAATPSGPRARRGSCAPCCPG